MPDIEAWPKVKVSCRVGLMVGLAALILVVLGSNLNFLNAPVAPSRLSGRPTTAPLNPSPAPILTQAQLSVGGAGGRQGPGAITHALTTDVNVPIQGGWDWDAFARELEGQQRRDNHLPLQWTAFHQAGSPSRLSWNPRYSHSSDGWAGYRYSRLLVADQDLAEVGSLWEKSFYLSARAKAEEAVAIYEVWEGSPEQVARAKFALGASLSLLHDKEGALRYFREVRKLAPFKELDDEIRTLEAEISDDRLRALVGRSLEQSTAVPERRRSQPPGLPPDLDYLTRPARHEQVWFPGYYHSDGSWEPGHYEDPYSRGVGITTPVTIQNEIRDRQRKAIPPSYREMLDPASGYDGFPTSYPPGYGEISNITGLPRTNYVSGYTRSDGAYVEPYWRSHR